MSKEIAEVSIKPTPEFDWDALEASCTSSRKRNAKRENGSLVFCREPYAEEALKAYNGDFEDNNRVELVEVNSSYEGVVESINLEWCMLI